MPTTTTTTPQPTGIHTFKCWDNEIPRVYPLIHPWPCCGLEKHPYNIYGKVTYKSEKTTAGPNGQSMKSCGNLKDGNVVLSIPENGKCPNDQFFMFFGYDFPAEVFFTYPCWTASQFYPSNGLFGFSVGGWITLPGSQNSGGCIYSEGAWKFFGGFQAVRDFGYGKCTMSFEITGVG